LLLRCRFICGAAVVPLAAPIPAAQAAASVFGPRGITRAGLVVGLLPLKAALRSSLLKMLLCYGLARLIAVMLRSNHLLLLDGARIVTSRILPLVNR
jgi:hypothetical protein